jgi:hypothetical protein
MVVRIAGKRMYLWRAVDHNGEVLDMLVQRRRDSRVGNEMREAADIGAGTWWISIAAGWKAAKEPDWRTYPERIDAYYAIPPV